jgi:hypothetical protein
VSDDHELRSRLERLASSAGDPPEHGLERVAARRHRRLHRRRGAVATAAVLAVLAVAVSLISGGLADGHESVTLSESAEPAGSRAEFPSVVEVRCTPMGIDVPVASVRPARDGLHLRVLNSLPTPVQVEVTNEDWSSGPMPVPVGAQSLRTPVPPGVLAVGCIVNGVADRRRVDLVDTEGYYKTPELACDEADRRSMVNLPIDPPLPTLVSSARAALAPYMTVDQVSAAEGYPSQRLGDPAVDQMVQVRNDDEVVALAHVRGATDPAKGPWAMVSELVVCASVLTPGGTGGTTPPSTAPDGGTPPAAIARSMV